MPHVKLSKADARRLLAVHHFAPTTAYGVFERLGSIQFDPLKPVGSNHDLVLQARVPTYKVNDWQHLAYEERFIYDAWDKQASLVLMKDYPYRRIYHTWHDAWWREKILDAHADVVKIILKELKRRGPLTGAAFEHQAHVKDWEGSWYGPKLTKNVLRALWHTGKVLTHSRKNGHHVYDLVERIVPRDILKSKAVSEKRSLEFLTKLRHSAVGFLRPGASAEVWSFHIPGAQRRQIIDGLVAKKELLNVDIEGVTFHALPSTLEKLNQTLEPRMIFVAPLDQIMWDRKAVAHIFDFEYLWEVYVPEPKRKWGYYVLPVFYGDTFVARLDSRLSKGVWNILSWTWETKPTLEMFGALETAVCNFRRYLGADSLNVSKGLDMKTKSVFKSGFTK
ncbi:MAG: DNA glycosylase AlkZ-like family protein [Trueperaceae bacterium]